MSTYILMKIFEKIPKIYDRGIAILSSGELDEIYNKLMIYIKKGDLVLDIGCGTGNFSIKAAKRGAKVKGIDINTKMLEIAEKKANEENVTEYVQICEMGVAELDREPSQFYDIIFAGLCLSELNSKEFVYTLKQVKRVLKDGGKFIIVDEVVPKNLLKKLIYWIIKIPQLILTIVIARERTKPLRKIKEKLVNSGFVIDTFELNKREDLAIIVCQKIMNENYQES